MGHRDSSARSVADAPFASLEAELVRLLRGLSLKDEPPSPRESPS